MTTLIGLILFSGAIGLCVIGVAGMVLSNNLFRMVLALAIAGQLLALAMVFFPAFSRLGESAVPKSDQPAESSM